MLSFSFIVSLEKNHFFFMGSDPEYLHFFHARRDYERELRTASANINMILDKSHDYSGALWATCRTVIFKSHNPEQQIENEKGL